MREEAPARPREVVKVGCEREEIRARGGWRCGKRKGVCSDRALRSHLVPLSPGPAVPCIPIVLAGFGELKRHVHLWAQGAGLLWLQR